MFSFRQHLQRNPCAMTTFVTMVTLPSCLLAVYTSGSQARTWATDNCFRYDANGCSIPFNMYFFYKVHFTPSCNRHDICYACGVAFNVTRAKCDNAFRRDTASSCRQNFLHSTTAPDTPASDEQLHVSLRQKTVLSITESHAERFVSVFRKVVPSYIHFCETMGRNKGVDEFIQRYRDYIVTDWATLLARHLHEAESSAQTNRRLPYSGLDIFRMIYNESVANTNVNIKHKPLNMRLLYQAKNQQFLLMRGAMLKYVHREKDFCERIQRKIEFMMDSQGSSVQLLCPEINLLLCYFFSEVYFLAVELFGFSRYNHEPEFYCNQTFVPQCLPPTNNVEAGYF